MRFVSDANGDRAMSDPAAERERLLRTLYDHLATLTDRELYRFLGFGHAPTWSEFRAHYDRAGEPDVDRAFFEVTDYPPIRSRIETMRAELRTVLARGGVPRAPR